MKLTAALSNKTALITGAARRLGAQTARTLHENGANIIIHYSHSKEQAEQLSAELNQIRPNSTVIIQADLTSPVQLEALVTSALDAFKGLDFLINNASTFYPTPLGEITYADWNIFFVQLSFDFF